MIRFLLLLALLATPASGQATWYEHYESALSKLDRGEAAEAQASLEAAVALRPEPGLQVKIDDLHYIDYLPFLYLAVTAYQNGRVEVARVDLRRSEELGVAATSEAGKKLLEAYRILLKVEPREVEATGREVPGYADYETQPGSLSASEFESLKRGVLFRCGLGPRTETHNAPWYFHYELGLELTRRDDPQRAVDAFVRAAEIRPASRHAARMYGMWLIDYLPYFEIAKAHLKLGNVDCARDALRRSRQSQEVSSADPEYADFQLLEIELFDPEMESFDSPSTGDREKQ